MDSKLYHFFITDIFDKPGRMTFALSHSASRILLSVSLLVLLLFQGNVYAGSEIYYVGPDGTDDNPGNRDAPWASLEHAGEMAEAGDEVLFLPGRYRGTLAPQSAGTSDDPVIFRAEERRTVVFEGEGEEPYAIILNQVEHIKIEGIHVDPVSRGGQWLYMEDSANITLKDCLFENGYGGTPFLITESRKIWVLDSVIRKNAFNMARIEDSDKVVFEGNAISRAGHAPLQFHPANSNSRLVVRANVFHAAWGRAFAFSPSEKALFENNVVANSYNGARSASATSKFAVQGGVFRFNKFFRNHSGPLHLYAISGEPLLNISVYHNVFHDNAHFGMAVRGSDAENLNFLNNIYSQNDQHASWTQLRVSGGNGQALNFHSNLFFGPEADWNSVIDWSARELSVNSAQETDFSDRFGEVFKDNHDKRPGFTDAKNYQLSLHKNSGLMDSGTPLTYALDEGESDIITVDNPYHFYDGFSIPGETGDSIYVGENQQQAKVVAINYEEGELELDRQISWEEGDPVSLPWSNANPDIGVYEHGGGRPSVEIRSTPFEVETGERVELELVKRGITDVRSITWQLGDGTLVTGAKGIIHKYDEAYDYPVRVRVENREGEVFRGVGLVDVKEPADTTAPLISNDFGIDDKDWWWRWQTYRPPPVSWERLLVLGDDREMPPPQSNPGGDNRAITPQEGLELGTGWLRVYAEEDEYHLPARIYPENWFVDKHPQIRIRYRIEPGTPVGVYVNAFLTPADRNRDAWLATSPSSSRAEENPELPQLIDDGEWHTIHLDARAIRDSYPDADVLEGLHIWSEDIDRVEAGHAFELDEVEILPEMGN